LDFEETYRGLGLQAGSNWVQIMPDITWQTISHEHHITVYHFIFFRGGVDNHQEFLQKITALQGPKYKNHIME
jgi:hypothetical protein